MKIQINIDTEKDGQYAVTSALHGHKFRAILWEMLHNKRKQIVECEFEDNGKTAQADGAERVFEVLMEEIDTWGVGDFIEHDML